MARFEGIDDGYARREAQARLNNYNRQIAAWQREADTIPNGHAVDLRTYLGFTDEEIAEFTSPDEVRFAIYNRQSEIDERVNDQRERMRQRNREQSAQANARAIRAGKGGRGRGRPTEGLMSYGQYVYFAVGYNHGQGAGFLGYGAASASAPFEPTHITEWDEV